MCIDSYVLYFQSPLPLPRLSPLSSLSRLPSHTTTMPCASMSVCVCHDRWKMWMDGIGCVWLLSGECKRQHPHDECVHDVCLFSALDATYHTSALHACTCTHAERTRVVSMFQCTTIRGSIRCSTRVYLSVTTYVMRHVPCLYACHVCASMCSFMHAHACSCCLARACACACACTCACVLCPVVPITSSHYSWPANYVSTTWARYACDAMRWDGMGWDTMRCDDGIGWSVLE